MTVLAIGDRWQALLLDSSVPGTVFGRLGADQLAWLDERLDVAENISTVLALHHPPISLCPSYRDCCIEDADAVLAIVDRHDALVAAVVAGHAHWPYVARRGSTEFYGAPSTAIQVRHDAGDHIPTDLAGACQLIRLGPDGSTERTLLWLDDESEQRFRSAAW